MSATKNQGGKTGEGEVAEGGRVWSTPYMAVAFGLGLAVGFLLGGAYGAYWADRKGPAAGTMMEQTGEAGVESHEGHDHGEHDHGEHDHDMHDHSGHDHP